MGTSNIDFYHNPEDGKMPYKNSSQTVNIFYDVWMECKVPTLTYSKDKNHENKNENGSER